MAVEPASGEWAYLTRPRCLAVLLPSMAMPVAGFLVLELMERKTIGYHPAVGAAAGVGVILPTLGSPILAALISYLGRSRRRAKHIIILAMALFTWAALCGCIQYWCGARPPLYSPPGIRPPAASST